MKMETSVAYPPSTSALRHAEQPSTATTIVKKINVIADLPSASYLLILAQDERNWNESWFANYE